MKKNIDMLHGPVLPALTKLALPIMATSLIQMAYNLTDMIWIGRLGSNAVAAVGAAGMYMWLSNGLASLSKMGGQVNTGYSLGSGSRKEAAGYIANTLRFAAISGIIFWYCLHVVRNTINRFFQSEQSTGYRRCENLSPDHLWSGCIFLL